MLDVKLVREQPDVIRETLKARDDPQSLDELLTLEQARRKLIAGLDRDRSTVKKQSDEFARSKKAAGQRGTTLSPPTELKQLSDRIKQQEEQLRQTEQGFRRQMELIPNIPHRSVPVGDAGANQIVRTIGKPLRLPFTPKTHVELVESLGLIDFARGAKVSGSNFPLYVGQGARLERALIQWMLEVHTKEHGYTEISPPFLVNAEAMFGTGQLPKFEEDMYRLRDDPLFLVPTAEVPLTNLHRDEILDEERLPVRYTAYTACFRREAGSYGKETKGLVRVHQFDKVELVTFATPDTSYDELERLLGHAETILKRLGLHYRVVCLATGDLGFAAAKCYDLEVWAPGLNRYLEVSSCSNFESFQARRAKIRYRATGTKKVEPLHTLNGSGVALARTLACLLETFQQADGHVAVPEVLRPYLDGAATL